MDIRSFKQALPGAILSAVFSLALVVGFLAIGRTGDDPVEIVDDFTVTIEYDCRVVIMKPDGFPDQVIEECRNKVRFLAEPNKRSSV